MLNGLKIISQKKANLKVIGVGGAGGNAVNTMISEKTEHVDFIVANTDGQALSRSLTTRQIQLGKNITLGLGAGSDAETGKKAADESIEEIIAELSDVNISVYDINGRLIETLYNGHQDAGFYEMNWHANNQSSGLYIVRMIGKAGENVYSNQQKIMLLK